MGAAFAGRCFVQNVSVSWNGESVQTEYAGNGLVLMQRHQEVTFQGADAGFGAVFDSAGARKNPLRLATVRSGHSLIFW